MYGYFVIFIFAAMLLLLLPVEVPSVDSAFAQASSSDSGDSGLKNPMVENPAVVVSYIAVCSTLTVLPLMLGRPAPCLVAYEIYGR
jgi:hypothetical protein